MALSFVASSAWVSSASAVTPGVPTGTTAGDFVVITLVSKYDDASLGAAPTGWEDVAPDVNTTGRSTGNDNGNVRIRAFWRIWQAGDTMPSLAPTPNNVSTTMASTYRVASGMSFGIAGELVADSTTGSPLLLAVTSSLGLTSGDIFHWDQVINGDVATWGTSTVTVPSCTVGANTVNTADLSTATGTDLRMRSNRNAITAGTSTGNAQVSTALAGTTTNAVGVGLLLRIREVVPQNVTAAAASLGTTADVPTRQTGGVAQVGAQASTTIAPQASVLTVGPVALTGAQASVTASADVPTVTNIVTVSGAQATATLTPQGPALVLGAVERTGATALATINAVAAAGVVGGVALVAAAAPVAITAQGATRVQGAVSLGATSASLLASAQGATRSTGPVTLTATAALLDALAQGSTVTVGGVFQVAATSTVVMGASGVTLLTGGSSVTPALATLLAQAQSASRTVGAVSRTAALATLIATGQTALRSIAGVDVVGASASLTMQALVATRVAGQASRVATYAAIVLVPQQPSPTVGAVARTALTASIQLLAQTAIGTPALYVDASTAFLIIDPQSAVTLMAILIRGAVYVTVLSNHTMAEVTSSLTHVQLVDTTTDVEDYRTFASIHTSEVS